MRPFAGASAATRKTIGAPLRAGQKK